MSLTIECPHCQNPENVADMLPFWNLCDTYMRVRCNSCDRPFIVVADFTPSFYPMLEEDAKDIPGIAN